MPDPNKELVVGEWYYLIECPHCDTVIPLMHDPSKGKFKFEGGPDSTVSVKCRKCGQQCDVPPESIYSGEAGSPPE